MIPQGKLVLCGCGGNAFQRKIGFKWEVYCHDCENTTGLKDSVKEAASLWNRSVAYEGEDLYSGSELRDSDWAGKDFGDQ